MPRAFLLVLLALLATACSDSDQADVFGAKEKPPPRVGAVQNASRELIERFNRDWRLIIAPVASHEHVEGPVDYSAEWQRAKNPPPGGVPPVLGKHNPKWLRCEIYDAPVPNEYAVHSVERSAVWITYRPGLPPEQVRQLVALSAASDYAREYTLVSPYEGLAAPIIVVVPGRWMPIDSASDPVLPMIVESYAGYGGFGHQGCKSNGVTPQQAEQELASFKAR
jgi:Protein of unknown function (DUF3105)